MSENKIDFKLNKSESVVENVHYIKNEVIEDNIEYESMPVEPEPPWKIDLSSVKTEDLTESNEDKKLFVCTYCSEKFEYIEIYEVHSSIHKTSKQCPCCTKKCANKDKYASHIQMHIDKCGSCKFCHKIFFNINKLRKHETEHKKNGALVCPYCGKTFTIEKSLVVHIRVHTNERPYICDICNKSFKQVSAMRNHQQLLHFERKPYICKVCDGEFSTNSSLNRHLKRIHSSGRKYFCKTCKKDFLTQDCNECLEFNSGISHSDLISDKVTPQGSNLDIRLGLEAAKDHSTSVESKNRKNKFVCPFCAEVVDLFAKHIMKMHSDEKSVKKIMKMPPNSSEKRRAFTQLKEGIFPESSSESECSLEDNDECKVKRCLVAKPDELELYSSLETPIKHEITRDCEPDVSKSTAISKNSQTEKYQLGCPFCPQVVNRFSRHVLKMHSEEKSVKKITKMPLNSLERRQAFIQLREGSFPEPSSENESSLEDNDESPTKRFIFIKTEEPELYPSSEISIEHEVSMDCEEGVLKSTDKYDTSQNKKKQIVCIYCFKVVDKFARHIMRKHSDIKSVKKIMEKPPGSERRKAFKQLKMGEFRDSSSESEHLLDYNDQSDIKEIRIKCEPGATDSPNSANSSQEFQNKHNLESHSKLSSFYEICSICTEEFFTYQKYCAHKLQHFKNTKTGRRRWAPRKKLIQTCWLCGEEVPVKNWEDHRNDHMFMTKEESLQCYKSRKFTCKVCGSTYSKKISLLRHMNLHMEKIYECKKGCGTNKMYTYMDLNRHNVTAHSQKIRKQIKPCFLCGVEIEHMDYKNHINEHIQLNDNEIEECKLAERFPCKQCGITFGSKGYLLKHIVCHLPKIHSCQTDTRCLGRFYNYMGLKEHQRRMHDSVAQKHYKMALQNRTDSNILIKKRFKCAWCSDTFNNSLAIKDHYKTHKPRDFKCHMCNKHFPSAKHISRHMRYHNLKYSVEDVYRYLVNKSDSESDTSKFSCTYCKVTFVSLIELKKHKKMHYTNRNKCSRCQMCFTKASQYTLHVKRNNCTRWAVEAIITEAKDLRCNYCNKSFSTYFQTTKHISIMHSQELYSCKLCNSSHSIDSLITHMMRTHRGVKKYSCAGCQVSFKTFKAYLQHRRWCVQCPLEPNKNRPIPQEPKNENTTALNSDNQDDFIDIPETVLINENGDIIVSENIGTSLLEINKFETNENE